jgi:hypothetical protein
MRGLDASPAGDQIHDQNDDRDHEQQVDKWPDSGTPNAKSKSPQDQQDYDDRPKHIFSPP